MLEVDVEMVIKVGDWVMSAVLELAELEALQVTEEQEAEVVVEAAVEAAVAALPSRLPRSRAFRSSLIWPPS